jgi:hypothetical protein
MRPNPDFTTEPTSDLLERAERVCEDAREVIQEARYIRDTSAELRRRFVASRQRRAQRA